MLNKIWFVSIDCNNNNKCNSNSKLFSRESLCIILYSKNFEINFTSAFFIINIIMYGENIYYSNNENILYVFVVYHKIIFFIWIILLFCWHDAAQRYSIKRYKHVKHYYVVKISSNNSFKLDEVKLLHYIMFHVFLTDITNNSMWQNFNETPCLWQLQIISTLIMSEGIKHNWQRLFNKQNILISHIFVHRLYFVQRQWHTTGRSFDEETSCYQIQ